jgi:hypothetical protein
MGRSDGATFFISLAISRFAAVNLGAIMLKHEKTDRRGKVAMLAIAVDRGEKIRRVHVSDRCNFLEGFPERLLEAHTGVVPPDAYGPFHIQRLLPLALHETTR